MTKKFVQKNIKLSLEFDEYLAKHPELYDSIPDGATIVITLKSDRKFSEDNITIALSHKPQQPVLKAEKSRTRNWDLIPLTFSPA